VEIAAVGRGNVGGGLAKRWRRAGHEVTEVGRLMAVSSAGSGPVFYRVGPPGEL
jgi:predicted dinucleotide-binding enzyme